MNAPHCQKSLQQDSLKQDSLNPQLSSSSTEVNPSEARLPAASRCQPALNLAKRVWRFVSYLILHPDEPTVWHKVDRQGRIKSWHVYDPLNGQSICFGSEMEVRLWLEHRYYR